MPYPPCTLCLKQAEETNSYFKRHKREMDDALPAGTPRPRVKRTDGVTGGRLQRGPYTDNNPRLVEPVIEGVCNWCSMLIAGYIESLRQKSD